MPPKHQQGRKDKKGASQPQASSSNGATTSTSTAHLSNEMIATSDSSASASSSNSGPMGSFTFATWNVLADSHAYAHYYPHLTKQQLSWGARLPLLLSRIKELTPDILCMQEVDHWKDWEPKLKGFGYTNTYLARGGSKEDGCSISFQTDRFMLVNRVDIHFDEIANHPFNDPQRIKKHCVALGLVLRPLDTPDQNSDENDIFVVTTHLFWNPKFEDVKLRQAIMLTYQIAQEWPHLDRLILCGDLNSTPDSAIATFFRTGKTDLRTWPIRSISGRGYGGACEGYSVFGLDGKPSNTEILPLDQTSPLSHEQIYQLLRCPIMTHRLSLQSVYQNRIQAAAPSHGHKHGKKGESSSSAPSHEPITSHFKQFSGTLDYIFVSPRIHCQSVLKLPQDAEWDSIGHLPTTNFASDHMLLMAELRLGSPSMH